MDMHAGLSAIILIVSIVSTKPSVSASLSMHGFA